MLGLLRQFFFIPAPTVTEKGSPDQMGRVFIVTGGYTGVGLEVSQMIYGLNATVYLAGRSENKAKTAISRIKQSRPHSTGRLEFLQVDLQNLATIKPGVQQFLEKETRLDVLINNAGVMFPPKGSVDTQGNELQIGTNCLGSCLLYRLLEPQLARTAATSFPGSVRVTWAGSLALDLLSPKPHGIIMTADCCPTDCGVNGNYGASKVGNLRTELQRHWSGVEAELTDWFILHPAINGGYTELYAALSPELDAHNNGAYVIPWGRFGSFRDDIKTALEPAGGKSGSGNAAKFVTWCERQTEEFL